ncbi:MAG: tetratricopeptide repeat protein [Candidatus Sericytochromatia bacterium]|nr:tetratricopeptide repeat protein [Candidatus Sericytochromatia bacterium]
MLTQYLQTMLRQVTGEPAPRSPREQALADHAAGQWGEALAPLRACHEANPADQVVLLALVDTLKACARFGEAEHVLKEALRVERKNVSLLLLRCELLQALDRKPEASKLLERALELAPKNAEVHLRRGALMAELGQNEAAMQALTQAVLLDRKAVLARYYMALICLRTEEVERAKAQLELILKIQPSFPKAQRLRAQIAECQGDWRVAAAAWGEVLLAEGEDAQVIYQLGKAQLSLGERSEALSSFKYALTVNPACHEAAFAAAQLSVVLGDVETALPLYRSLLVVVRYHDQAKAAIARLSHRLPQQDRAACAGLTGKGRQAA